MSGATALYLACRAPNVEIVELLLAKGANIHEASRWKMTNRNCCGSRIREEPLRFPIHGLIIGWQPANHVAWQQILRLLISAGTDINAVRDENGDTPLLSLFKGRNYPDVDYFVVNAFLQAGADYLAVDKDGNSSMHRCLRDSQNIRILKLLFDYGVPANVLGQDGDTILHVALSTQYNKEGASTEDIVNFLLEIGAPCDVKNKHGITAVEHAAGNVDCSLELFTILVQACADVQVLQRCIWPMAAWKGRRDTPAFIRVLQQFGISLEDRDIDGRTVLLKSTRNEDLFASFLECGADMKAVDYKGRGVLHHFVFDNTDNQPHGAVRRLVNMVDMGMDPLQVGYEASILSIASHTILT
jgi:hypothetical protein